MGTDKETDGNNVAWFEKPANATPQWHGGPQPLTPEPPASAPAPTRPPGRTLPYLAVIAALVLICAVVWQHSADDKRAQEHRERAAAYKGVSAVELSIDGIEAKVRAKWSKDGRSAILSAWLAPETPPKIVRIVSGTQMDQETTDPGQRLLVPINLQVQVPVKDWYQPVRMTVGVGGPKWQPGDELPRRQIEFRPDRTAIDTETGKTLKQHYSRLL
ncbi:hypothetical protein [Streptomyces rubiginosohelvolus]|uniref:hypothetical protein n=1 Tax=Streptomyces rubiginosohelvolus TaxID=67362 RepID=UPI002BC7E2B8|nr:hypothetical protein [Ornithinicoccus sp.]